MCGSQLINHPKEQAEYIMLLDLGRNDLGRVCEHGSIHVNEIMTLESYPFVHHIVSNIRGKIKPHITIKHLISALFPGGTITGCPKVRCMQIIAELEKMPRQA
jgi:anthranilate synthase component 1